MTETPDNTQPYHLLNKLNLIVTIFIALLGGFISVMQFRLSNEQQKLSNLVQQRQLELESRLDLTEQSAELLRKAKEYLDILNLEETKKKLVLISLLQLEKELRTSKTGELDAEQQMMDKVNALPYNMALLAGASEALAHIGGTESDLKLWLPIAKTSGDIEVRKAAIDALRNVGLLTDDYDTLSTCVESIIELTRRWNVPELQEQAQAAITTIAEAYRHVEVDEMTKVNTLISDALRELEGTLLAQAVVAQTTATREPAPPDDQPSGTPLPPPPPEPVQEELTDQVYKNVASVRELRQFYAPPSQEASEEAALQESIANLRSDSTKTRRLARSQISDFGNLAVPKLLELLSENPDDYNIKIGVVTALLLMEQPVSLKDADLSKLVMLLGDKDETVRKNTAVFLGKLTDRETVQAVRKELENLSAVKNNLSNGNLIYNSVIVLGDWLKFNNEALDDDLRRDIRQSLRQVSTHLDADSYRAWSSTKAKIKEYLSI